MNKTEQNVERRVNSEEILSRVRDIESWISGPNGARGAEERLQGIENKLNAVFIMVGIVLGQSVVELILGYIL